MCPPPSQAHPIGCFTHADLRAHGPSDAFRPLLLVADHHASVASALSRSLADSATVLSPVASLALMRRIVPVVSPLVLVSELDYGGVLALDVLQGLARVHSAIRIIACAGHDNDVMRRLVSEAGLFGFVAKREPLDKLR